MQNLYSARRLRTVSTMLAFFMASSFALAQTAFTGAVDADWFNAANWSNGLPAAGNNAILPGGASAEINSPLTANFDINSFGTITATAPINLQGSLSNSGMLSSSARINNRGNFDNFGDLSFGTTGSLFTLEGARFRSNGSILNEGWIGSKGEFINDGDIEVTADGGLAIYETGTFANSGVLNLAGFYNNRDGGSYSSPSGGTINVLDGGRLNNYRDATITNAGIIRVELGGVYAEKANLVNFPGRIFVAGKLQTFDGSKVRSNFLTVEEGGQLLVERGDSFEVAFSLVNAGTVSIERPVTFLGVLTNEATGTITTASPGVLDFVQGTDFTNAGTVVNGGVINTVGLLLNTGTFTNTGTFQQNNGGLIDNKGDFRNEALIANIDNIQNDGNFVNAGRLTNGSGGIITNAGDFVNEVDAHIENLFQIINKKMLTNRGFFENGVTVTNEAIFDNYGFLSNVGDIENLVDGVLTNFTGGVIDNSGAGILTNDGLFVNDGEINNFSCGILVNNGTIENNSWIQNEGIFFQNATLNGKAVMLDGPVVAENGSSPKICQPFKQKVDQLGGTTVSGRRFAAPRFDSCEALTYLINGEEEQKFTCADIGDNEVIFTLVDRDGNRINCKTILTITDEFAPQITNKCPTDIFLENVDSAPAAATWTAPTFKDNCDSDVTVTSNFNSGDLFPEGTTVVTYTANDNFGNEFVCEFSVRVTVKPVPQGCTPKDANGLVAYYNLRTGGDKYVLDGSGYGVPLHMENNDTRTIKWDSEGCGLVNHGNSLVKSYGPASKIGNAAMMTNALTVEAWVNSARSQKGPARIVTYSENATKRNFTLGQEGDRFVFRLKTTRTNDNGTPDRRTKVGSVKVGQLQHLVFTRDANGQERFYVDGDLQYSGQVGGNLSNWGVHCNLAFFNEMSSHRSFKGAIKNVAIYDRALSSGEVVASNNRGLCCEADDSPLAQVCKGERGQITYERYENIGGNNISWLVKAAKFPARADATRKLTKLNIPRYVADSYGSRTRGFIYPNKTGNHRFAVSGDDNTIFLLSPVAEKAEHAYIVASVHGYTSPGQLHKYRTQKSGNFHMEAGKGYYFELLQKDGRGGDHATVFWQEPGRSGFKHIEGNNLGDIKDCGNGGTTGGNDCVAGKGGLLRETWTGIRSNDIWALLKDSRYPANPSNSSFISSFAGPVNDGDNYGTRVRGYIHPEHTGDYVFTVTGDDQTKLMLSTDDSETNARGIAMVTGYTNPREFHKYSSQTSTKIRLEAGKRYYVELLHQEGVRGDFFNVFWQTPKNHNRVVVPGENLSPYKECSEPVAPSNCNQNILFVVGNTRLNNGDAAVKHRLEQLGYNVTVKDPQWATADMAADKGLVIISSTVQSTHVGTKFRDVKVPVMTWESWLYDDMRMTGNTSGRDYGTSHTSQIVVSGASDPLALGRGGRQEFFTRNAEVRYGKVMGSQARVIGHAPADVWLATFFVYDAGAQMAGGMRAPGKRIGFGLTDNGASFWTSYGKSLFDAAVRYATDCESNSQQLRNVDVLTLRAEQRMNAVRLDWTNNTAFKNASFLVERSSDDVNFYVIDEVMAEGEGSSLETLEYFDATPNAGDNFYRITAVYTDGTDNTSELRLVSFADLGQVGMFPNPAEDQVSISLDGFEGREIELHMTDALGRLVMNRQLNGDDVVTKLDVSQLPAGMYSVTLQTGDYRVSKSLSVSRD